MADAYNLLDAYVLINFHVFMKYWNTFLNFNQIVARQSKIVSINNRLQIL